MLQLVAELKKELCQLNQQKPWVCAVLEL